MLLGGVIPLLAPGSPAETKQATLRLVPVILEGAMREGPGQEGAGPDGRQREERMDGKRERAGKRGDRRT